MSLKGNINIQFLLMLLAMWSSWSDPTVTVSFCGFIVWAQARHRHALSSGVCRRLLQRYFCPVADFTRGRALYFVDYYSGPENNKAGELVHQKWTMVGFLKELNWECFKFSNQLLNWNWGDKKDVEFFEEKR